MPAMAAANANPVSSQKASDVGHGKSIRHPGDEVRSAAPARFRFAVVTAGSIPEADRRMILIAIEQVEQNLFRIPITRITRGCRYILCFRNALIAASGWKLAGKAISPHHGANIIDACRPRSSRRRWASETTAPIKREINSRTSSAPHLLSSRSDNVWRYQRSCQRQAG